MKSEYVYMYVPSCSPETYNIVNWPHPNSKCFLVLKKNKKIKFKEKWFKKEILDGHMLKANSDKASGESVLRLGLRGRRGLSDILGCYGNFEFSMLTLNCWD